MNGHERRVGSAAPAMKQSGALALHRDLDLLALRHEQALNEGATLNELARSPEVSACSRSRAANDPAYSPLRKLMAILVSRARCGLGREEADAALAALGDLIEILYGGQQAAIPDLIVRKQMCDSAEDISRTRALADGSVTASEALELEPLLLEEETSSRRLRHELRRSRLAGGLP